MVMFHFIVSSRTLGHRQFCTRFRGDARNPECVARCSFLVSRFSFPSYSLSLLITNRIHGRQTRNEQRETSKRFGSGALSANGYMFSTVVAERREDMKILVAIDSSP